MMQKKNRKKILSALFIISILSLFYIGPSKKSSPLQVTEKSAVNHKDVLQAKKSTIPAKENKRLPASYKTFPTLVSSKPPVPLNKRNILNSSVPFEKIFIANKYNEDWEKIYTKNFLRMTGKNKVSSFKTIKKRSVIKVEKNKTGILLEHIVVSYKKPNGHPFSFEAYINSETGHVYQTWNKTRYEFSKKITIDATNYGHKAN